VDTPRGLFAFKIFFSKGFNNSNNKDELNQTESSSKTLAAKTIKANIETLIENEDTSHPLRDEKIREKLLEKGMRIARRTVTKYREAMRILPSHLRKK